MSFSKTLAKAGRTDTGRWLDRSSGRLIVKKVATLVILQLSGKQPVAIEILKISQRDCEITGSLMSRNS